MKPEAAKLSIYEAKMMIMYPKNYTDGCYLLI